MKTFSEIEYPYFKKGQVLTNTELNNMVAYLDEQNRTTRVLVVGSGIFSGLEVDVTHGEEENDPVQIEVSQGFGLSSDGYIIQLNDDEVKKIVYTHYKKLVVSERHFRCVNSNDDTETEISWDTFELLQEYSETEGADAVKPLNEIASEEGVSGAYCLILWVSQEQIDRPYCIDICDDNGADLNVSVKALLVKRDDLQFVEESEENVEVENDFNPPSIHIPAFGYTQTEIMVPGNENKEKIDVVNPSLIENYDDFLENYVKIIRKVASDTGSVEEAYSWAYNYMGMLGLAGGANPFNGLNAKLTELLKIYAEPKLEPNTPPENIDIQYLFLYLHDLKEAFEEFVHTVCNVQTSILPDLCGHARHIALGGIAINTEEYPFLSVTAGCRTTFQPSLFNGVNSALIKEVEFLFDRMKKLTSADDGMLELPVIYPSFPRIRVIPGRERQKPLSKHSIPYYYKKDIKDFWISGNALNCPDYKITGYRYIENNNFFPTNNPLLYQDDEYKFFRIEGHVGKDTQVAYDSLKLWIDHFNLPVALKIVYLDLVDSDREEYDSLEMKVLEEKYVEVRDNLLKWLAGSGCEASPSESELALSLPDFDCNKLRKWFDDDGNCYRPYIAECYLNALTTLSVSYDVEQRLLRDMYRFSEFAGAHPGMQHVGGVPKGGTFVLVNATVIDAEIVEFAKRSKKLASDNRFGDVATVDTVGMNRYVKQNASHIVVGDFALPYLCCENGIVVEPILIINPVQFCSDDDGGYELWSYPNGGTLSSNLGSIFDNNGNLQSYLLYDELLDRYMFKPSGILFDEGQLVKEIIFQYTIRGLKAKARVRVYRNIIDMGSEIEISGTPVYNANNSLVRQNVSVKASFPDTLEHEWLLDGTKLNIEGNSFTRIFNYSKPLYELNLVLRNGVCETWKEYIIDMCDLMGEVSLEFNGSAQFSETPEEVERLEIVVNPGGGTFAIEDEKGNEVPNPMSFIQIERETTDDGIILRYYLLNSPENPFKPGRYTLRYSLPACGGKTRYHDFYVQSDPEIIMQRDVFCAEDDHQYIVNFEPDDAQLSAEPNEGLLLQNGLYYFQASEVNVPDTGVANIKLLCKVNENLQITKELTVYKLPESILQVDRKPNFDEESCKLLGYQFKYRVSDGLEEGVSYQWYLNDSLVSESREAGVNLELGQGLSTLRLKMEKVIDPPGGREQRSCTREIVSEINACSLINDVSVSITPEDGDQFRINATPPGGNFSLYVVSDNGNIFISDIHFEMDQETACENQKEFTVSGEFFIEIEGFKPNTPHILRYGFEACDRFEFSNPFIVDDRREEPENPESPENPSDPVDTPPGDVINIPGDDVVRDIPRPGDVINTPRDDVRRNITPPVVPGDVETDISPRESENLSRILNSRANERKEVMDQLASDTTLANTKTFGLARMFILFTGPEKELSDRYQQALNLGISSMKRASGDRKAQYAQIIENITLAYLDKLVASSPDGLSDETKNNLKEINANLKANGIKINKFKKDWDSKALKKVMNGSSVDEISKMLK